MNTLVIHTGAIGDFLLACPAIAQLAQEGPVTVAGHKERAELAIMAGIAVAAHSLDAIDFHSVFTTPSPRLRAFLQPFQRAIIWMRDDGAIANAFHACGVQDVRAFPGLPPDTWSHPASEYYCTCINRDSHLLFALPLSQIIGDCPYLYDVVLHPGSGSAKKNWPFERFLTVAEELTRIGRRVVWCAGPAEEGLSLPANAERLPLGSLVALAERLANAKLYVGNDSGITHLAAAAGCPTVAIFGPTDPRVWAPRGPRVRVVQGQPWPETAVVMGAIGELVDRPD